MGKGRVKEFTGIWPPKPDADLVEFTKMPPGGSDSLKGKGAVVTGAASGIGKAIAKTGEVVEMKTKEHTTIRSARVGRKPIVAKALRQATTDSELVIVLGV